ncbi:Fungal transcriptional regulatory [Cordyceps militaris]|uniref:Fungal transcriptional regulatory n=1 Tax=Cordyceps militaris TaxID=73501 RepID=A0A2H4SD02_CORMI|nr:Fungal transcriptional regulatory [Cordyceps militaris]
MAEFLASFNFGAAEEEPVRDKACSNLDEVLSRFRDGFEGKVTETRAERIKISVDIGPSANFTIFGGQGDNVDPSLSRVSARDALVSQPQQTPITQRAVSQEILNAIGNIDGSTWSMTEELRKTQGWVMTYACNHSWQQWTRRGKATQTQAILDYSQKELDPTSRARPAFDCRGTVTITFSKGNSAITVNYAHTPFHRTVGEQYDLFKPPPPPPRAVTKKKAPGSAKKSDTPRRKRAATGADGEPTPKRPRRPKKGAKNQLSQAELVPITEGFPSTNGNGTTVTAIDAADHAALAALSVATAGEALPNNGTTGAAKNNTASLNVSPEEAARRRETATKKLVEAGIDPDTLNADQFSIFSNQSPEVQNESLNMLVKYGAERLHIVHPPKKDSPRPAGSQPDAESIASGSVNPNRIANHSASENVEEDASGAEANGASETPRKAKRGTKSRCSKEKPTCNVCQESGLSCEYPAPRPRHSKSAAIVTEDDDTIMSENVDAEGEVEDSRTEVATQAEDPRPPSIYAQVPIANMMQITPDDEGNGSRPIGEASIQSTTTYENRAPTSSLSWSTGGLALPQGRVYYPPDTSAATSAATREPLPNNARTVVDTPLKRSQRVPKPTAKVKSRVPTPVQSLIASPPNRARHESPLERHNPRRHEAQPRNPLAFERSPPPTPYGQPATHPQYASDPYRQNSSYGQSQGAYPQLQATAPDRVAYDPDSYRNPAPPRAFNQQEPQAPARAPTAKPPWPSRGQDAAAADTLQRIHGYGGNDNIGSAILSAQAANQRGSTGSNSDGARGVMAASKRGASRKSYSSQPTPQQAPAIQNQPQHGQQPWYGFNGLHGGSTTGTQSNHNWGGSGGSGWN